MPRKVGSVFPAPLRGCYGSVGESGDMRSVVGVCTSFEYVREREGTNKRSDIILS